MTFLWPSMLLILLSLPIAIWLYLRVNRQRRALAANFGSGLLTRTQGPGVRRHIPPALFLISLTILLIALARPQAEVKTPRIEGTVILVFDVSASMGAKDVKPSRMEASKTAAREFVLSQPQTVKIGVVSFSGSGFTIQEPTNDTTTLLAAINRLEPSSGTSLGQGILTALHTIAVDAGLMVAEPATPEAALLTPGATAQSEAPAFADEALLAQLPEGPYPSAVIVMLSDGEDNQSIDPLLAAQAAAERTVRIDALGFGTSTGTTIEVEGFSVHTMLQEGTLQQITQATGGTYYPAQSEQDPQAVYANLTPQLVVKSEMMEITSILAGASVLVMLIGSLFSLLWFNRLV